jgi:hypothetical protein
MHNMYGRASATSREARRLYTEHYPQGKFQPHKLFTKLHQRLSDAGYFVPSLTPHCSVILAFSQM